MTTPFSFVPENFLYSMLFQRAGFIFLFSFLLCAAGAQQPAKNTGAAGSLFEKFYIGQDSVYRQAQQKTVSRSSMATAVANRSSNANGSCATSTFYLHIKSASNEKIELKEIQTLPGGEFILAGNIILSNNEKRGVLYLLSNSGNLMQKKYIQVNNLPVTLEQVRVKLTGEIVVAGMMSAALQKTVLISLQSDLSVNWAKTFETAGPALKLTLDFDDYDNATMLAIRQASSVVYTMLDKNGTAVWTKEIGPIGLKELAGFTSVNYNYVMLILNCENAGKKSVLLIDIDIATGNVKDTRTAGNGTDEYEYNDLNTFNGRMLGFGVVKDPLQPFRLVRNIVPVSSLIETEHRYTFPAFIPGFGTSCTADNAGDAIAVSDAAGGSLYLIKHFAYYQTSPEQTRRYNVPTGARVKAVARSLADGGYLMGLNTALLDEVVLIKTDSIGLLGGCSYETITVTADEQMQITNKLSSSVSSPAPVINSSTNAQLTDVVLSVTADCMQTYCPPAPVEDTCLASYFKTYRSNSYSDEIGKSFLMRNNKILTITRRLERVLGNLNQLSTGIKLFKENGIFEKAVTVYFMGKSVSPFDMIQVDSSHVIMGNSNYEVGNNQVFTFSKMNDDLQIEWSVSYRVFNGYNFGSSGSTGALTQDSEGNLYFTSVSAGFMENPKIMVMKMDKNGVQQWVRIYEVAGTYFLMCNAVAAGNRLVVVVEGADNNSSTSLSIDKNTGELLNIYKYPNDSDGWMYKRMLEYENGKVFYAANNKTGNLVLAVFDTTGKPIIIKNTNQPSSGIRAATYKNGKLYGLYNFYSAGSQWKNAFFVTDTSLIPLEYNEADVMLYGFPSSISVAQNGNIYVTGSFWHGDTNGNYYDGFIQKLEPDGKLGVCAADHPAMPLQNLNFTATTISATTTSTQMTLVTPYSINLVEDIHGLEVGEILCSSDAVCNSIKLAGPVKVCQPNQQQTYTARRNIGCVQRSQFECDSSFLSIVSNTDTSLTVLFKKTGTTWIKVKLDAGCTVFTDSMQIEIGSAAASFYLGADTTLCVGNSIHLHAPVNYQSYEWQDHSTAATLHVTNAGKYWITAVNYCGEKVSDTVTVNMATVPVLTIGNDTSVCTGQSLNLKASNGFSSYGWKGAGLLSAQGQSVQLTALQNTSVSVKAITTEGCIANDTLQIQVISARPFSLGNDTSFCANGQIRLAVSNSYAGYAWSNGTTGTSITANTKGIYWLLATDMNGCKTSDTMQVKQVFQLPVINLGPDGDICKGETRLLDPGSFSSYVWQNGSVNRLFTAASAGIYWVKVADINGCATADTVEIKTVLPVPVDFLPAVDTVCQYDKISVGPVQSFNSYLWSTGVLQQHITVQSPGTYTLTVKSMNGCTGMDTILIIGKYCNTGAFFPNAFTPNGDRLNDVFQPIIFGRVLSYKLELFNRFGQLVFSTTNPLKGFEGLFNGLEQPASVFSWQCAYQLEGGQPTYRRGLVTLIR